MQGAIIRIMRGGARYVRVIDPAAVAAAAVAAFFSLLPRLPL